MGIHIYSQYTYVKIALTEKVGAIFYLEGKAMQNGTVKYMSTIGYLSRLYDFLNGSLFDNELIKPVITVQYDKKNRCYGWWSVARVWKENEVDKGANELNLTAQTLNRPISDIAETLLHEMCHQYADVHDIKDTSRSGYYHNKKFKKIASEHGLLVEFDKSIGWSITSLKEDIAKMIEEYATINNPSIIYRIGYEEKEKVARRHFRMNKYFCNKCGVEIKTKESVNIMCMDCNIVMRKREDDDMAI